VKAWLGKAKTPLESKKNVARKAVIAFTERKRHSQRRNRVKTWLGNAKTPLQSENAALSKAKKTLLPSEAVTRRGENALTEPKRLTFKPVSGLPSEDIPCKGENGFTERKRSTKINHRDSMV